MCAVPSMAVFFSTLTSCCFPGILPKYCLSDLKMVPVAAVITGITFALTFHMHRISIIRAVYCRIFSVSFLTTFLPPEIAASINMHVPF